MSQLECRSRRQSGDCDPLTAPDSSGTGSGICKASLRIMENMQPVIDNSRSFSVDRESYPGLIRDSELGLCRPVEDPNRLDEAVIFYRPDDTSISPKDVYPGPIIQQ